jgi:hypothetical protein
MTKRRRQRRRSRPDAAGQSQEQPTEADEQRQGFPGEGRLDLGLYQPSSGIQGLLGSSLDFPGYAGLGPAPHIRMAEEELHQDDAAKTNPTPDD